jgi:hypothetical protein
MALRYNRIHILGNDSPAQLKKYRVKRGSRLKLLRRTLRERKLLANLVLELRVPEMEAPPLANGRPNPQFEEYRDLVASVVMVCPNLERLVGFDLSYHHEFDRLVYALSTRKKLKEHKWIIGETAQAVTERLRSGSPPPTLDQHQVFEFLDHHVAWTNLETLMLHSLNMNGTLDHGIFLRMFNCLPSLRNLCISSFDAEQFTDRTLLFLPPLESLRLENLRGVTDTGLAQYVSRQEVQGLKSLTLIEQNIRSLLVISKIFTSLRRLERFNIVQQSSCPILPSESMVFQPILASSSLKYLHWDVAGPDSANALSRLDSAPFVIPHTSNTPNFHLAQSILHAGFPRLGQLRAPSDVDPPGVLQAVCRPIANGQALIPSDRYSLPRSSHGSVSTRPLALPSGNNLTSARIRAQTFIDMAAKDTETGMKVVITDHSDSYVPDNVLECPSDEESDLDVELFGDPIPADIGGQANPSSGNSDGPVKRYEFRMPAIMGRIGSTVKSTDVLIPRFVLRPDLPGADADGGLVGWKHLLASNLSLSYAAGVGTGNLFHRTGSSFSFDEAPLSPASTSPFAGWRGFGGRSATTPTPITPTSPPTPMTFSSSTLPPWTRDTCNGSWNQGHKNGKEWWSHVERERQGNFEIIEPKQFF